ncbi:hypothetical protein AGMMS49960_11190 [Betaproteobacteria bacterium]|nr:hypothetical protein AGMMS49543_08920 [Betaproteobacteria bacterium]GHU01280.1 hypothetical protein AGMMS49960_11190 [Betaproteobacteria bacterium]GHU14993.1 hypothetical protein AGMMS50225_27880 [Betaproteobacteria bacterium]GHU17247.1 hypothetical protein AGMMS50243_05140 [Betaproteobacteria bacterium]
MRQRSTKNLPSAESLAAALAAAPDYVDDPDCPYDPNDAAAVSAFWSGAIVSHSRAELQEKLVARRGRPLAVNPRKNTNIRLAPDVESAFRATGKGWQTRINAALADWLKTHSPTEIA